MRPFLTSNATGKAPNSSGRDLALYDFIGEAVAPLAAGQRQARIAPVAVHVMVKRGTTAMRFSPRRNASSFPRWLP
jgi:hypothetical protein